jgi:CHASE2 domain-containing sensor protein
LLEIALVMHHALNSRTLGRRLVRTIPAILLAIFATIVLNQMGILNSLERNILNFELKFKPPCLPAGSDCRISVVMITDTDYDNLFRGRSPLNSDMLQAIIAAIAMQDPKVIAVDIDTSARRFRSLNPQFKGSNGKSIPVIWEREVKLPAANNEFYPSDVLGGQDPQLNKCAGIPVLFDDPLDKETKYYKRCFKTKSGDGVPSFVYAVATASKEGACHATCGDQADEYDRYLIWFTLRESTLDMVSAETALDAKNNNQTLSVLKDRIVILGGRYRDYDRHFTPLGTQVGAITLANALQTELELSGPRLKAPSPWTLLVLDIVASIILVLVFHLEFHVLSLSLVGTLFWGSVTAASLALAFSFLTYWSSSGLLIFGPTLLAVLLFEIYEYVRHQSILRAIHPNSSGRG